MTYTMEYDGYVARIEYDSDHRVFDGIVQITRDTILFEGASASERAEAFRDSIGAMGSSAGKSAARPANQTPTVFHETSLQPEAMKARGPASPGLVPRERHGRHFHGRPS